MLQNADTGGNMFFGPADIIILTLMTPVCAVGFYTAYRVFRIHRLLSDITELRFIQENVSNGVVNEPQAIAQLLGRVEDAKERSKLDPYGPNWTTIARDASDFCLKMIGIAIFAAVSLSVLSRSFPSPLLSVFLFCGVAFITWLLLEFEMLRTRKLNCELHDLRREHEALFPESAVFHGFYLP